MALTHFWPILPFIAPENAAENLWFPGVFTGYKMETLVTYGLKLTSIKTRNNKHCVADHKSSPLFRSFTKPKNVQVETFNCNLLFQQVNMNLNYINILAARYKVSNTTIISQNIFNEKNGIAQEELTLLKKLLSYSLVLIVI